MNLWSDLVEQKISTNKKSLWKKRIFVGLLRVRLRSIAVPLYRIGVFVFQVVVVAQWQSASALCKQSWVHLGGNQIFISILFKKKACERERIHLMSKRRLGKKLLSDFNYYLQMFEVTVRICLHLWQYSCMQLMY